MNKRIENLPSTLKEIVIINKSFIEYIKKSFGCLITEDRMFSKYSKLYEYYENLTF
jgi:hypothetical protein